MDGHHDTLKRLLGPAEPELLCDECFEKLDEYVDAELAGAPQPAARRHLRSATK